MSRYKYSDGITINMKQTMQRILVLAIVVISGTISVVMISHYNKVLAQTQVNENQKSGQIEKTTQQQPQSTLVDIFKRVENSAGTNHDYQERSESAYNNKWCSLHGKKFCARFRVYT